MAARRGFGSEGGVRQLELGAAGCDVKTLAYDPPFDTGIGPKLALDAAAIGAAFDRLELALMVACRHLSDGNLDPEQDGTISASYQDDASRESRRRIDTVESERARR